MHNSVSRTLLRSMSVCVMCVCTRKVWSCYSWRLEPSLLDPEDEGTTILLKVDTS